MRQWPHVHPGRPGRAARGPLEPAAQPPPAARARGARRRAPDAPTKPKRARREGRRRAEGDAAKPQAARRRPRRRPTAKAARRAKPRGAQAGARALAIPPARIRDAAQARRQRRSRPATRRRATRRGRGELPIPAPRSARAGAVRRSCARLAGCRRGPGAPSARRFARVPALPNSRASCARGTGDPLRTVRSAGANRETSRSAVVRREPVSSPRRPSNESHRSAFDPPCRRGMRRARARRARRGARRVAAGHRRRRPGPADARRRARRSSASSSASPARSARAAGGRSVEIQAQRRRRRWTTIATTRAAADGSLPARVARDATTGRWTIRAQRRRRRRRGAGRPSRRARRRRSTAARRPPGTACPATARACGVRLRRSTIGVAHRTLPCGTLVDVTWGGRSISVPVDRPRAVRRAACTTT